MRIVSKPTLKTYWHRIKESKSALEAWYDEAKKAKWKNSNEVKSQFGTASIISNKRVVFNICGNKHRLIVDIEYRFQTIYIVWVGTHKQYDLINVKTIEYVKTY